MNYLPHDRKILSAMLAFAVLVPASAFAKTIAIHLPVLAIPAQADGQGSGSGQGSGQSSSEAQGNQSQGAQNGHPHGRPAWEKQAVGMRKLMNDLQLTDAQRQKVRVLIRNHRRRIMALRQDQSLSQDAKNQKLKAVRQDARKRFQAILTPEQKEKLKEIVQQNKQKQQQSGDSNAQTQGGDHAVNASAEQDDPAADLMSDEDDATPTKAVPGKAGK